MPCEYQIQLYKKSAASWLGRHIKEYRIKTLRNWRGSLVLTVESLIGDRKDNQEVDTSIVSW